MPADRLITLTVRAEGMRDDTGVYIPGAVIATLRPWVQVAQSPTTVFCEIFKRVPPQQGAGGSLT